MRAWLEVNLENIHGNILTLEKLNDKKVIPVLKANAYGMGAKMVASYLYRKGVNFFATANIYEALEIKSVISDAKILVLGPLCLEEYEIASKNGLTISVTSIEALEYVQRNNLKNPLHLKLDTGMTRVGFDREDFIKACTFIKEHSMHVEGLFTHFSDADGENQEARDFTNKQIEKYKECLNIAREMGIEFEYRHIQNSAGAINYRDIDFTNFMRVGLALHGYLGNKKLDYLKPSFEMKGRVVFKKTVKEDSFVSYSRRGRLKASESYAVISLGYEDGLKRDLSYHFILKDNTRYEIIGVICMDMFMVKVPKEKIEDFKIGDEVTVLNEEIITAISLSNFSLWELMTGIGNRVARIYRSEDDKNCG